MQKSQYKYIGKSRPIKDAVLKATGQLKYAADLKYPNMLYAKMLFSPVAHAKIKHIDTREAEKLPGVYAVVTYKNAPQILYNSSQHFYEHELVEVERIFSDTVRYVGDRVAAVAAVDLETATKAVKLIKVTYEELPAVFDPEEALKAGAPRVYPSGNKAAETFVEAGDVEQGFAEADLIFEDRYTVPQVHHGAIEPHVAIADYDVAGKLTVLTPSQNIFAHRVLLARIFNMPFSKIRVIKTPIGGAFGGKGEMVLEPVVALLAKVTGRPVKLELSRAETIVSTRTRHGAVIYLKTGVKKDGRILAQDVKVIVNTGAYASCAMNIIVAMCHKVFKIYKTEHIRFKGIAAYTNLPISGAMRGFGSPQIIFPIESQLHKIAKFLEIDMVELQLKNLIEPGGVDRRFNTPIGNSRPIDCVLAGAEAFQWSKKKLNEDLGRYKRGIGMAVGCHGNSLYGAHRDYTALILKMNEDGTATLFTGTHDMGSGAVTVQTQIIGEILGINPDDIACVEADTELVPWNLGDYASRGTYVSGNAAKKVAESMKAKILEEAAGLLKTKPDELYLENGHVYSLKEPSKKATLCDVIIYSQRVSQKELIAAETYAAIAGPHSYGAHFAEVEVDTETGQVKVLNYVATHDVGKAINPNYVLGQIGGGIQMGIGYALTESLKFDSKGKVTNSSFKKYHLIKSSEMPQIKIVLVEKGEETGPYGAKGIGEIATVPSAPAVVNAINNALGSSFNSLPVSPEKILKYLNR
jgi:CO/xanthine dehydrogenase Mo-binding subunit